MAEGLRSVRQRRWGSTTLQDTIIRASILLRQGAMVVASHHITDRVCILSTRRDSETRTPTCCTKTPKNDACGVLTVFRTRAPAEQQPELSQPSKD